MARWWLALILPSMLAASPALLPVARAAESPPVRSERLTATLVSDTDRVEAGKPLRLGLRLRMAPGWHTYWQNPGDAGAPTELTLVLPDGAKGGPMEWPGPLALQEGPVMTYAYSGEVVLPLTVTPGPQPGPLHVQAEANWLVCERICVPEEGKFTLDLAVGTAAPSAEAPLFAAADARLPRPSPFAAHIAPDGALSVSGDGLTAASVKAAWFFPGAWGAIDQAAPQPLAVRDGGFTLALKPGSAFDKAAPLTGVLSVTDAGGQQSFLQLQAVPGTAPAASGDTLPRLLLFAVLGGLILNLMPCVFPVLAMKAVSLAKLSGAAQGAVRANALSYTAGVMAAFGALGLGLVLVRAAGSAAGWGFQFQSPVFVAAMAWLLFGMGLNLSGVFQIGAGMAGAGQGLASRGGHAGSFATGLLAVVVATPCTAPFMGAALAGALTGPGWAAVLVFLAMGLGLAAPYAVLAVAPALARLLPRPGPWMDTLKQVLAFPMYGAAAWLLWVLSLQAGSDGVLAVVAGAVLLGFAAWALGRAQMTDGRARRLGQAVALAALLAIGAVLPGLLASSAPAQASAAREADGIEPFSPARLAALRAEGRPVFVNMTAAWCVSCLVNERIALSQDSVKRAFADRSIAYLKGDWTRGDPAITAFLRDHARDGVPLYVFYPAGGGTPQVLPQILTAGIVLDQITPTTRPDTRQGG